MKCKVDGCECEARYPRLELCDKHYNRFHRNGTTEIVRKAARPDVPLTAEELRRLAAYDPETGEFTRRQSTYQNGHVAGEKMGCVDDLGYIRISIGRRRYRGHRLAWLYVYGKWPDNDIDHINGVRTDNRIANLRDVPRKLNLQNARGRKYGVVGMRGVTPAKRAGAYRAQIGVDGRVIALGVYETPQEAHLAWLEAKRKYHPGFLGV